VNHLRVPSRDESAVEVQRLDDTGKQGRLEVTGRCHSLRLGALGTIAATEVPLALDRLAERVSDALASGALIRLDFPVPDLACA
jgi:hypothetical protein